MSVVDPEKVEALVTELGKGITALGPFAGQDATSAVLTFSIRFLKAMLQLSPKENRRDNALLIATTLRRMAAEIEFDTHAIDTEVIH